MDELDDVEEIIELCIIFDDADADTRVEYRDAAESIVTRLANLIGIMDTLYSYQQKDAFDQRIRILKKMHNEFAVLLASLTIDTNGEHNDTN